MAGATLKSGRYEIKGILGHGGMGVVYRCYDALICREVALKTLRDAPDQAALSMFHKECKVLAALSHPNIVEIFDVGELEEGGAPRPYFVMPLLPGVPLDHLLKDPAGRPAVERVVDILCQVCRGLQAAHERGLVHRDIKPSNIFVMSDDSVKIIDFGVAHMVGAGTSTTAKGTLFYMAPEQIRMQAPSALSDVFSLGVVAWQCFTGRRPFEGATEEEVARAILERTPPPASDANPEVNRLLGRVVHKSMAKEPRHRFGSAREFAEALQRAARGEALQLFDPVRIRPRVERAARAFEQGDHAFASEILGEIEAEGYLDTSIAALRRAIDRAARERNVAGLLEAARRRFAEGECGLALEKVREALQLDPENPGALEWKRRIGEPRVAARARRMPGWALPFIAAVAGLAVLGGIGLAVGFLRERPRTAVREAAGARPVAKAAQAPLRPPREPAPRAPVQTRAARVPAQRKASIAIHGAVPGAQVLLDGTPLGLVAADGGFAIGSVAAGDHAVELRKENYRPRMLLRRFGAGEAVRLGPGEIGMAAF